MEMNEEQFLEEVQYFNTRLSEVIEQKMRCESNKILADALNYIRDTGGKRLRPIICLLSAEAVGGSRDKALSTAIALELLHNATLVHDDVIDENYVRRKNPSNPARYGEKQAIVIGDLLLGLSCEMLGRCGDPEIMILVTRAISDIAMGQYLEFTLRLRDLQEATEQLYMEVAELKTASAFMASAEAGAMLGCGSEIERGNLRNYGKNLGMAFQIQDDVLDICGDPAKTGKSVGLDIKNGERTILVLHALNHSNPSEKQYIEEIMAKKMEVGSSEIDRVREIFINCRSISYAMSLSNGLVRNAKNSIEGLEDSEAKSKLQHIADLAAKRIEEQALDTFIQH
jgi:geranylgeranyl pyrophosphate synthase